jgi:hypothetical protein
VVTPLDIPIVVIAQNVHDVMRTISTVENVPQDVETVDGQSLNQITKCNDKVVCPTGADDGVDDDTYIGLLVRQGGTFMQ